MKALLLLVDYDSLKQEVGYRINGLNEMVKIMVDVLVSEGDKLWINQAYYPYAEVKKRMLENNYDTIMYIFKSMKKNATDILNIRGYLLTVLFNAPATIDNYYTTEVNSDLGALVCNDN